MKAVILAAGLGSRLGEHANGQPKCLLQVGELSLIEHSLNKLARAGIMEVVVILGFRGELVSRLVGEQYAGMRIRYVQNPEYDSTGNMYSLACAEEYLTEDTMVLEADLIYQGDVITRLIDAPQSDVIVVGPLLHHGDDIYIRTNGDDKIIDLGGKMARKEEAYGALLGISKYSAVFMRHLFAHAKRDFAAGDRNFHYEETVLAASQPDRLIHALDCRDVAWTEIDNANDLARARESVYPLISEREKR